MIPFSSPTITGNEIQHIKKCINNGAFSSGGEFTDLCKQEIKNILNNQRSNVFMTPSCTQSLEAAVLILDLKPGDEVIMPSFTFVTTATSFSNMGINIRFVDVRSDTLNIDENKIEEAITKNTKAIVPVHYAGVSCEMDRINKIAKDRNLFVIEDAAQGMFSFYKERHLGTLGDISAFSFHDTKNIHCGEGGSLVVNNDRYFDIASTVIEKGTNRKSFLEGRAEKYTWVSRGSSYSLSDMSSAFLIDQLYNIRSITHVRRVLWDRYLNNFKSYNLFETPCIPDECRHNGHIFHIRLKDKKERALLMKFLEKKYNIKSSFHFVPLHSSLAGKELGKFIGADDVTTTESEKILRLPIFNSMSLRQVDYVCEKVLEFFND
jgi:dTDP-4-amino-4,6-dideoxygalactose transaminase